MLGNQQEPRRLQSFFDRFKKIVPHDRKIKDVCIKALQEQCNIFLENHEIRVMKNTIYLRTTPIKKTEILRKKDIVIQYIEQQTGIQGITLN